MIQRCAKSDKKDSGKALSSLLITSIPKFRNVWPLPWQQENVKFHLINVSRGDELC